MVKMKSIGERGFLTKLLPRIKRDSYASCLVPPGDDAVVLKNKSRSVLSIDGITEGTHFKLSWDKKLKRNGLSLGRCLGWKLLGSSLSDLAAMGETKNRWAMIYAGVPGNIPLSFLNELYKGVKESAKRSNCTLAGGDTVRAKDLSLVCAVGGDLAKGKPLTREGSRPGDQICVTGLNGAFPLKKAYFDVRPKFKEGKILQQTSGVHAVMDLSDSFVESIGLLLGPFGAKVQVERIPESTLTFGEDYGLLFTALPQAITKLRRQMRFLVVGEVRKRGPIQYFSKQKKIKLKKGYAHF